MQRLVQDTAKTNLDINPAQLLYAYTATADRNIFFRVLAADLDTNGGMRSLWLEIDMLGAGTSVYTVHPITNVSMAAGITKAAFITGSVPVKATDKINVWIQGTTSDIVCDFVVEVWDDCLPPAAPGAATGLPTLPESGLLSVSLSDTERLAVAVRTLDTNFLAYGPSAMSFGLVTGSAIVYGERSAYLVSPSTLTHLSCAGVPMTLLDVSLCTALQELGCADTGIVSVDVSSCAALTQLQCDNNPAMNAIDVTGCASLVYLSFSGDAITTIDLSTCATLVYVGGTNNALTTAAVNAILADLVANNQTNGTVNLVGGTNAAPTGQGIIDAGTLVSRGWAVATN